MSTVPILPTLSGVSRSAKVFVQILKILSRQFRSSAYRSPIPILPHRPDPVPGEHALVGGLDLHSIGCLGYDAMPAPHPNVLIKLVLRLLSWLKPSAVRKSSRRKGFVLPIAILIVLVLSLVTVGLLTRSTQRNLQTQVERAGQIVNRQLTSVLDRARAKIDYLNNGDRRLPRNSPGDDQIREALINFNGPNPANITYDANEPYLLPDETLLIMNGEDFPNPDFDPITNPSVDEQIVEVRAPVWYFTSDTNSDGDDDSITAYTIITNRVSNNSDGTAVVDYSDDSLTEVERARRLVIRGGTLAGEPPPRCIDDTLSTDNRPESGDWFLLGSRLVKPFQVFSVTLPIEGANSTTRAISASQFQTDRQRSVLNKFGFFGRSDGEYFTTPNYNWNGAIFSSGSLFFNYGGTTFDGYLISSQGSCYYLPRENSEIKAFGEFVAGAIGIPGFQATGNITLDGHPEDRVSPSFTPSLDVTTQDSVVDASSDPESIALDPLELYLYGRNRNRGSYTSDPNWSTSPLNLNNGNDAPNRGRVEAGQFGSGESQTCPPYVDDVYRADNRFGPKPSYDRPPESPDPDPNIGCNVPTFQQTFSQSAGAPIGPALRNNEEESLTENNPAAGAPDRVGLDGYWERRSRVEGLRVIVGQRLELTRSDSLPLPLVTGTPTIAAPDPRAIQPTLVDNEARQRMTLQDNPAAVQATAVYHYSANDGSFPVACLATVAHPGSADSLKRASVFPAIDQTGGLGINFFTGQGTNTWEYDPAAMESRLTNESSVLWRALTNLANFAGDPLGAYPPTQQAGRIHPDPFLTAFGDFSELKRITDAVAGGVQYEALSLADQTTVQTAGCMLGMLADNILRIQTAAIAGDAAAINLLRDINDSLDNGQVDDPATQRIYLPLRYLFPTATFTDAGSARAGAYPFVNTTFNYQAIPFAGLTDVRLSPRAGIGAWALPHVSQACPSTTAGPNSSEFELIRIGTQCHRVPFKDSVFYDGREAMAVRNLNVDLSMLVDQAVNASGTSIPLTNAQINGDTWLPNGIPNQGGIFYAFREDAVREDDIARPALTPFASYETAWQAASPAGTVGDALVMNAGQPGRTAPVGDPPIEPNLNLSGKSVDFFADPDRRPFGFRLRNGSVLQRGGSIDAEDSPYGLSFISDNPVYIQGDFNLHQQGPALLEEFTDTLNADTYANFYDREEEELDPNFARVTGDSWRPTDVLGDSVNILSANFCDGSVDDGFTQDGTLNGGGSVYNQDRGVTGDGQASSPRRVERYGCTNYTSSGRGNTSFINQSLVIRGNNWPATDPNDPGAGVQDFFDVPTAEIGSQDLGNRTDRPGHSEVFARNTIPRGFRDIRPIDADSSTTPLAANAIPDGYTAFPPRISALGNPVLDTSRWVLLDFPVCEPPNGSGLLAEYYNGWLDSPRATADAYNRNTGFGTADLNNPPVVPNPPGNTNVAAPNVNLPFLRAVRLADPAFSSGTRFNYQFDDNDPFGNDDYVPASNGGILTCSEPTIATNDTPDTVPPLTGDVTAFQRSCWRRISGANDTGSANNDGRDNFVIRWVGELFPMFPGDAQYQAFQFDDGLTITIRDNPAFFANPANTGSGITQLTSPITSENWSDSGSNTRTLNATLECSPNPNQSPYLIEIQMYENGGGSRARFRTRLVGEGWENYRLDYLLPATLANSPCLVVPPTTDTNSDGVFDADDTPENDALCGGPPPECVITTSCTDDCAVQGPGQPGTRTCTNTSSATCPGGVSTSTTTDTITCPDICTTTEGPWGPDCTLADGGQTIPQTRTITVDCAVGADTTTTETRNEFCPEDCNYGDWTQWEPPCPTLACGTSTTIPQTRSRDLIPATSSPTCADPQIGNRNETCTGDPCDAEVTLPRWMRPGSLFGGSDTLQAAAPDRQPARPSLSGLGRTVKNALLGEPVQAAPRGSARVVTNPRRPPGIKPAFDLGTNAPPPVTPTPQELRDVFSQCEADTPTTDPDGGFWVPGVFRPNFNTTFTYTAYNGDSVPSTLRFAETEDINGNGILDAGEDLDGDSTLDLNFGGATADEFEAGEFITDRDPLFGFDVNSNGVLTDTDVDGDGDANEADDDVQPIMRLNPYARVTNGVTQNYGSADYLDGYYMDDQALVGGQEIRNGLCFRVRENGGNVQVEIDRNGTSGGGQAWVTVEALSSNINAPSTGFAGTNPTIAVILDERTRRPIPVPGFQDLVPSAIADRKRNDNGTVNNQLIPAGQTRVNALAISGIIPSRLNQHNGGIPNFFRLNENWDNVPLFISGSLIQLNFSNYATAPLLQQSFEPPALVAPAASGTEGFDFYFPPDRRWGYDVGLQIARVIAPVPARFEFLLDTRDEFFRELEPQDPYVQRLRCTLEDELESLGSPVLDLQAVLGDGTCDTYDDLD